MRKTQEINPMKHQDQQKSKKFYHISILYYFFSLFSDDESTSVTDARQILERKRRNRK
jgi:hypothetical protein